MNYWARDTTQSDFGAAYTALCQQANEVSRVTVESDINASNSISRISASVAQCCCNFEEARMRIEEQTVEHYVPGFDSPFVTRQMVMQVRNDELEKKINDLMIQNMQGKIYDSRSRKTVPVEPKKKYTIYDLYDLVFPDDPIKKYFITVCNNIEKEYQKKKEVLDQIEAPEVEIYHVELVPTVTIDDDMMTTSQVFMLIGTLAAIASVLIAIHVILG